MSKIFLILLFSLAQISFAQTDDPLAPLIDLENGGEALGAPQGKLIQNPDGSVVDNRGTLLNGSLLPGEGEGFVRDSEAKTSWGTGMMISLIENSAALYMQTYQPPFKIYIGDIALQWGGIYEPHKSHQNGLDVDILYMGNKHYESVFDQDGNLTDRFNPEANWNYWRMLVSQQFLKNGNLVSAVSMILVDPRLKDFFVTWAAAQGISQNPVDAEILKVLRPTQGHDDHFHLRLKCSPYYLQCKN